LGRGSRPIPAGSRAVRDPHDPQPGPHSTTPAAHHATICLNVFMIHPRFTLSIRPAAWRMGFSFNQRL
jgi:hypothetical protein